MHLCAVLAPTQDVAFMYSIAWTAVQLLFNNFFITFKEVSLGWLTQLRWLSAMYYAVRPCARVAGLFGVSFIWLFVLWLVFGQVFERGFT
jgi:hypothetical protein